MCPKMPKFKTQKFLFIIYKRKFKISFYKFLCPKMPKFNLQKFPCIIYKRKFKISFYKFLYPKMPKFNPQKFPFIIYKRKFKISFYNSVIRFYGRVNVASKFVLYFAEKIQPFTAFIFSSKKLSVKGLMITIKFDILIFSIK